LTGWAGQNFLEFEMRGGVHFETMFFVMHDLPFQGDGLFDKMARIWRHGKILLAAAALLAGAGCTQTTLTAPARSATEQLLLSTAAERAIASTNLSFFNGKKVFFDASYFDSYDSKYALGTIRDVLSRAGALLVANLTNSDVIVEARSGVLSIDAASTLVGMPSSGVPVPFAGAVSIPEMAVYKSQKQFSVAKIALLVYETRGGKHVYSSGPMVGRAYNHYYSIIGFINFTSSDIPEKQKVKAAKQKHDKD
jgi:hypothetical protein